MSLTSAQRDWLRTEISRRRLATRCACGVLFRNESGRRNFCCRRCANRAWNIRNGQMVNLVRCRHCEDEVAA